jgi:PAS domain S-box-containing protein
VPFSSKGAVVVSVGGRIAFASTYFCDLVGVEHDKIVGMSWFDFVYPEDMPRARRRFELGKRPNAEPFRCQLRRTNGKPVWVEIQRSPMRVPHGDAYAVCSTVVAADDRPNRSAAKES